MPGRTPRFEEIDIDLMLLLLDESLDRVKARGPGADDCDAERSLLAADGVCGHVGQRARPAEGRDVSKVERKRQGSRDPCYTQMFSF